MLAHLKSSNVGVHLYYIRGAVKSRFQQSQFFPNLKFRVGRNFHTVPINKNKLEKMEKDLPNQDWI